MVYVNNGRAVLCSITLLALFVLSIVSIMSGIPIPVFAAHPDLGSKSSTDILLHINEIHQEIQRHNTTGALAELNIAIQAISNVSQQLIGLSQQISALANKIQTNSTAQIINNSINNNNVKPAAIYRENQSSAMMAEPSSYNALVNLILARQELHNGNFQGADVELNMAVQAISEFSRMLLSMSNKMNDLNAAWVFTGNGSLSSNYILQDKIG
jgi:hypothetical protein